MGGFNLYASTGDAFQGKTDAVAAALGVWSQDAVLDQDLGFSTIRLAQRAPAIVRDSTRLAVAVGLLMRARGLDEEESEKRIRQAALRARIPVMEMAACLSEALGPPQEPDGRG